MKQVEKENCCLGCERSEQLFTSLYCTLKETNVNGFHVCGSFTKKWDKEIEEPIDEDDLWA